MEHNHYEFKCSDIGMKCDFHTKAHSEDELMMMISEHAASVHDMTEPDEATMKAIKGAIKMESYEC